MMEEGKRERERETFLSINPLHNVKVNPHHGQVGEDVECAHAIQDVGVFKRNLLACLHEEEDDG